MNSPNEKPTLLGCGRLALPENPRNPTILPAVPAPCRQSAGWPWVSGTGRPRWNCENELAPPPACTQHHILTSLTPFAQSAKKWPPTETQWKRWIHQIEGNASMRCSPSEATAQMMDGAACHGQDRPGCGRCPSSACSRGSPRCWRWPRPSPAPRSVATPESRTSSRCWVGYRQRSPAAHERQHTSGAEHQGSCGERCTRAELARLPGGLRVRDTAPNGNGVPAFRSHSNLVNST
mmetsp:Transcript_92742/g.248017  ORF Transcript_92742/g.248017 Transcript_92742/m.248017 type:complete len:235 (-) Transcript_92742:33-737(-)